MHEAGGAAALVDAVPQIALSPQRNSGKWKWELLSVQCEELLGQGFLPQGGLPVEARVVCPVEARVVCVCCSMVESATS